MDTNIFDTSLINSSYRNIFVYIHKIFRVSLIETRNMTMYTVTFRSTSISTREHTENYFRNHIRSTQNQNVFTIFRLIRIQTEVRLDANQSENGKYNLISG